MLTVDLYHPPFIETASTPQAAATGAPRWEHSLPPMQKMLRYSKVNQPRGVIGLKIPLAYSPKTQRSWLTNPKNPG